LKRRRFTEELKREAVRLLDEPDVTCVHIAPDLGINANMLSRWRWELAVDGRAFGPQRHRSEPVPHCTGGVLMLPSRSKRSQKHAGYG
jgi:transposase-like protein